MSAPNQAKPTNPYGLQVGMGYSSYDLGGEIQPFSGPHYEFRLRQHFASGETRRFFLGGIFRYAQLAPQGGSSQIVNRGLSTLQMGLEGGSELEVDPEMLSLSLSLGLGSALFNAPALDIGLGREGNISNSSTGFVSLSAGLSVAQGLFHFSATVQKNFGLKVALGEGPGLASNPQAWILGGAIDVARLGEIAGRRFESPDWEEYFDGMTPPRVALVGEYAQGGVWSIEGRTKLYRPSDQENPLGFGFNAAVGSVQGEERSEGGGFYGELREAYGTLRLPTKRDVLLQGGRFFILTQPLKLPENTSLNFVELEDMQLPEALPLSFGGVRLQARLAEKLLLSVASLHNFDEFFGPAGGLAAYVDVSAQPAPFLSGSVSGFAGKNGGEPFTVLGTQAVLCLPKVADCQITTIDSRLNLSFVYYWGRQNGGDWHAPALFARYNPIPQLGFSGKVQRFSDPEGLRGEPRDSLGLRGTFHLEPRAGVKLRFNVEQERPLLPDTASEAETTYSVIGELEH